MDVDWDQLVIPLYESERTRGEVWLDWQHGCYHWTFQQCVAGVWCVLDSGTSRTDHAAYSELCRCFGEISG